MKNKQSTTEKFTAERIDGNSVDSINTGVWYSGFNKIKEYAVSNNIPFIAVWSNGDVCSLCKKLENNFMTDTFRNWMKTSGCVFWFGYSGDKAVEDKKTGKTWAKDSVLTEYPFMRFYWNRHCTTVNKSESGNWWNGKKVNDEGALNIINHIEELMKDINILKNSDVKKLKVRLNPEWTKDEIEEFRKAIKDNDGYCPCEDEHTPDTKCMCKNFRTQTTEGNCHCGLYDKYYA